MTLDFNPEGVLHSAKVWSARLLHSKSAYIGGFILEVFVVYILKPTMVKPRVVDSLRDSTMGKIRCYSQAQPQNLVIPHVSRTQTP
jgi:hypothetical protein